MKTKKARHDYLKQILFDAGLKSGEKITEAACKRLKAKRDRQKEIAELDVSNIIDSGAGRRTTRKTVNRSKLRESSSSNESDSNDESQQQATDFSRIKDLIASDESDSEKKPKKKKETKNAIDSD